MTATATTNLKYSLPFLPKTKPLISYHLLFCERFINVMRVSCRMVQQLIRQRTQRMEKPSIEEVERLLAEIQKEPELLKKAKEFAASIGSKA